MSLAHTTAGRVAGGDGGGSWVADGGQDRTGRVGYGRCKGMRERGMREKGKGE